MLTASVAVHVAVIGALLFWPLAIPTRIPRKPAPVPIQVSLLSRPPAPPDRPDDASASLPAFVTPPPPHESAPAMTIARLPDPSDILSEGQLAGATRAGEGAAGGGCDMAQEVQQALRHDSLVHAAVAAAHRQGKTIMLWDGDWVRANGQAGKGLSAVREAISWEVAFAPASCRNIPMHGLVLLSLADGGTRFVIGTGAWRWSDLLGMDAVLSGH
jgi:hypothetical protein